MNEAKRKVDLFFNCFSNLVIDLKVNYKLIKEEISFFLNKYNSKEEQKFHNKKLKERLDKFKEEEEKVLYGHLPFKRISKKIGKKILKPVAFFGLLTSLLCFNDNIIINDRRYYDILSKKPPIEEIIIKDSDEKLLESKIEKVNPIILYKEKEPFNESGKIPILYCSFPYSSNSLEKIFQKKDFEIILFEEYISIAKKIKKIKKDFLKKDTLDLLVHKRNWRNRNKEDYFGLIDIDLDIAEYKKPLILLEHTKGLQIHDSIILAPNPSDPDFDEDKLPLIRINECNIESIFALDYNDDIYISDGFSRAPEAKIYEEFEKLKNREIYVNLPEFKLYLCENNGDKKYILREYGIGIGKKETPTWIPSVEKQQFFISSKIYDPIWLPPDLFIEDIKFIYETESKNPMGTRKLELATSEYVTPYAIHGTKNFNQGIYYIGKLVSRGCIRVPEIEDLYKRTIIGNKVNILYKPALVIVKSKEYKYEIFKDVYKKTPNLTYELNKDIEIHWESLLNNSLIIELEN